MTLPGILLSLAAIATTIATSGAQQSDSAEVLIERLAHADQRATARAALAARGAQAVPAITAQLKTSKDEVRLDLLAALRAIGPAAAGAVPDLMELALAADSDAVAEVVTTLADLVPYRAKDVAFGEADFAAQFWRKRFDASKLPDAAVQRAMQRLRVRAQMPADLPPADWLAAVRRGSVWRAELAIERLAHGAAPEFEALAALAERLAQPDPRILGTDQVVPLRVQAARAMVKLAPQNAHAAVARNVLSAEPTPPRAPVVPGRTRLLLEELVKELSDPTRRALAVANLIALGEVAAPALTDVLWIEDAELRNAVLRALRDLGPRAAEAVPALYEQLRRLPFEHTIATMEALIAAGPWCRDLIPEFSFSGGSHRIEVGGSPLAGAPSDDGMTAFGNAYHRFRVAMVVDPHASIAELVGFLDAPEVLVRERALAVLRLRGAAGNAALPELDRFLGRGQPNETEVTWRQNGVSIRQRDATPRLHRAAAQAILAIARPGDPRCERARAVLEAPEAK